MLPLKLLTYFYYYVGLPITFLLGFYVYLVVKRWWEQYCKLPWPDSIAYFLRGLVVEGERDNTRLVRRTVIRYCLLAYILCIRKLSDRLMRRFPSMSNLVRTGIIRTDEVKMIGNEESPDPDKSNWWMPIKWSMEILSNAEKKGHVRRLHHIMERLSEYRQSLADVTAYSQTPVPLVYTQVVHLAVYIFFAVSLVADQWIIWRRPGDEEVDLVYPIFMTFKFLFIYGWLRVAETHYNPFGEDDEDFELNELLNRHIKVAMSIVDGEEDPPKLKDELLWFESREVRKKSFEWPEVKITLLSDIQEIKGDLFWSVLLFFC